MNNIWDAFFSLVIGAIVGIVLGAVLAYAYIGFSYSKNDARTFDSIIESCQTVGYIRNDRFEIDCEVKLRERNILNQ